MTPYEHATLHARDFGGKPEDYLKLDEFLDSSKLHCPDWRHRAILHSAFGMQLAEQLFGPTITNSLGHPIAVRELARRHIQQDLGRVPTLKEWLDGLIGGEARRWQPDKAELRWLQDNVYSHNTEETHV